MVGLGRTDTEKVITGPDSVPDADLRAAVEAHVWVDRDGNRDAIRGQVTDHLADLRTITGSSGSLTNAQLSNAVRVLARGQIRLIRLAVDLLDGTD